MTNSLKKKFFDDINFTILIGLLIAAIVLSAIFLPGGMFSTANIKSMAFQIPEFGFLALAMMLSNLIGGIDLSIISAANTIAIFTAFVLNGTWLSTLPEEARIPAGLVVAILTALIFGVFNGLLISKTSAPSLIASLGTMILFQGIGMALTGGVSIGNIAFEFTDFGKAEWAGIPLIFWLFLGAAILLALLLEKTAFGRKFYLYGENKVAARFSGINNEKVCIATFVMTSLLAGIAGLIVLSRVNSAKVGYGSSYLLQTIIVCVIGGISPNGGKGRVRGVFIAIVLMQLMSSAFTMLSLSPYTKKLIWGVVLILVLSLNHWIRNLNDSIKKEK